MVKFALVCFLGVVLSPVGTLAGPAAFRPTRNGGEPPEVFWFPNDRSQVVPALLHGKPSLKSGTEAKGIADDVKFYHYSNSDPSTHNEIYPGCTECMEVIPFVKGAPTMIMAHGFSSDAFGGFGTQLRNGFVKVNEPMNLIFVDWSVLAAAPWYEFAADNTKPVGQYTGMLVDFLISEGYSSLSDIHFLGHSLGAHVGNFVALNITGGKLARISALDPALPLFGERGDEERIDLTDATFVDVMHTAMGTLLDGGLAFTEPRGHVDFYPNGGAHQPECEGNDAFGACSHSKCYEYFSKSVGNSNYQGCKCDSWEDYENGCSCSVTAVMGYGTSSSARGSFYLRT